MVKKKSEENQSVTKLIENELLDNDHKELAEATKGQEKLIEKLQKDRDQEGLTNTIEPHPPKKGIPDNSSPLKAPTPGNDSTRVRSPAKTPTKKVSKGSPKK